MTRKTKTRWAFFISMLVPSLTSANNKVLSEGVCSTGCGIYVDTSGARVDFSTKSYSGGIANVGIFTSSNVVISSDNTNRIVLYATGSIMLNGSSLSGGSLWTQSGNNINNTNLGNVGISSTTPQYKLVVGSGSGNLNANGTDSVGILTAPSTQQSLRVSMGAANENFFLQRGENVGVNGSVNIRCNNDANNSDVPCTYAGQDHRFVVGNVTIGSTASPKNTLDVKGGITSRGLNTIGYSSDPNPGNNAFVENAYWAQSIDGATQGVGCVVAVNFPDSGASSQMVFTSTNSSIDLGTVGAVPGVLLESCAPGAICRVGLHGVFRVTAGNAISGNALDFSTTRCQVQGLNALTTVAIGYSLKNGNSVAGGETFWAMITQ